MGANMKYMIKVVIMIVMLLVATGCSDGKSTIEYTSASGNYSITLPSTWIQDTNITNGDILVLYSNEQRDIIISIQQYDREVAEDTMGLDSLQKFEHFYKTNSIVSTLYTTGEVDEVNYSMANMKNVIAEEVQSKSNDNTVAKAFCVLAETDNAYYTCTITGEQKIYNKNIKNLKQVLSAMVEK